MLVNEGARLRVAAMTGLQKDRREARHGCWLGLSTRETAWMNSSTLPTPKAARASSR